ncbi:MAG: hypothetical protein EXS13_06960 [Planctomycetes bacterium]|nr:hypothetical protein [Planctomycetota bacterium]
MNSRIRFPWRAAGVLLAAACTNGRGGDGEAYRVGGDPWSVAAAKEAGVAADGAVVADAATGDGKTASPSAAPAKPAAAGPTLPAGPTSGTVLEQLDAAKTHAAELERERARLAGEVASLTAVVDGLKRDNQNLAQLAQATKDSQVVVDGEIDSLRLKMKDLDLRSRQLADDLLSERIKRVRVERQLILARVTEAESQGDGP